MSKRKTDKKKLLKTISGTVIGGISGIITETFVLMPICTNWSFRSIMVAEFVALVVWSLVGGFIGRYSDKHFSAESAP